jgi:hypothetical protein
VRLSIKRPFFQRKCFPEPVALHQQQAPQGKGRPNYENTRPCQHHRSTKVNEFSLPAGNGSKSTQGNGAKSTFTFG